MVQVTGAGCVGPGWGNGRAMAVRFAEEGVRETVLPAVFSPLERLVLELTDAMTRDIVVPDALMQSLRQHFDATGMVEVVATVAAYNMVSRLLVALNIQH